MRELKILGLHDMRSGEWCKLVYMHSNSNGELRVNGEPARVAIRFAGEPTEGASARLAIVIARGAMIPRSVFVAINSGTTMLWADENSEIGVVCPGFVCVSDRIELRRPLKVGVLTISDKGARNEREDLSGPALADLVVALGSEITCSDILPDDRGAIAEKLRRWSDEEHLQLILTTGGTGLSSRDITPEALMDVHDRVAPGFGEIMRAHAMLYTERGYLSRSLAVIRGNTLIVAFPGSERAVRQCFEAVAPALRHGVETLSGWDCECGHH
ncbi:MAG: MogA/MoaB family molybdenum cofactor biosynthesis protein [Synergistaceae bacterium]|nr:MogA/MoaB family molybdenum cofactor biosynthesis protein [Synergistaceae bacterium]